MFLPDRFKVKQFGGNALLASVLPSGVAEPLSNYSDDYSAEYGRVWVENRVDIAGLEAGQIGGIVVDPTGAIYRMN